MNLLQEVLESNAENDKLRAAVGQLQLQVAALEASTGTVMPARTCIPEDMSPGFFHVIHGSKEGLACLLRRVQAASNNLHACHIALEVAGRAMADQKARADKFEMALHQEHDRNEALERRLLQLGVAV